jgi:hypothetical protein
MNTPVQPEAIAAMDKAVDRLASTEAHALAAFGVLDATVHQLVASIQTADSPARTAGFVTDTLQALTLAGQQLETYQDATDDVVVTAGAAVGEFEGQAPRALDTLLVRLSHAIEGVQCWAALAEDEFTKRCGDDFVQRQRCTAVFDNYRTRMALDGGLMSCFDQVLIAATGTDRLPVAGG